MSSPPARAALVFALFLAACEGAGAGPTDAGDADPSDGAGVDGTVVPDAGPCRSSAGTYLVRRMDFGREEPPGVAPGLDLDGRVSDETDVAGCSVPDLVDADGTPGIDNQLGTLTPVLETALGRDFAEDFRASIASGELLLLFELGVDPSGEATLTLSRGQVPGGGAPALDGEGLVAADQPLSVTPLLVGDGRLPVESASASCDRAVVTSGQVELPLLWPSLELTAEVTIHDAIARFETGSDGSSGLIAGHILIDELLDAIDAPIEPPPPDPSMQGNGDLAPDGRGICQSMSLTMVFDAVRVAGE